MPKRPLKVQRRGGHEVSLETLAKTRSIKKAAESPGIKRDAAYRHCSMDAAFAEGWDAALKWQTAFLESRTLSEGLRLTGYS